MKDHDRKKLWGKSAGTCCLCRIPLVHESDHPDDPDALVGDEAHIISSSALGPRGTAAVAGMDFDGYYNRILLCRIHHRIIDAQTNEYTVEKLRCLKSQHEEWVRSRVRNVDAPEPKPERDGLRPRFPGEMMILPRLKGGRDAWHVAIGTELYLLESIDEDEATPDACDVSDGFLTNLRDYAEIHDAITERGFEAVREAQRDLRRGIDDLAAQGLVAFGAQREMVYVNGTNSSPWRMAVVIIRPASEVGNDQVLPAAFPPGR